MSERPLNTETEHARAWESLSAELEEFLTTPAARLPCDLRTADSEILQACMADRRPIPGRKLNPGLWLYLLQRFGVARTGISRARQFAWAEMVFEEGLLYEGVFLNESFPYRDRATFHLNALKKQGRGFDAIEDYREWFLCLFAEAIKNGELMYLHEAPRHLATLAPLFEDLDARRPIAQNRFRDDIFASVYQSTLFWVPARLGGEDRYASYDWARQHVFLGDGHER